MLAEALTYIQTCHIILGGRKHHGQEAGAGGQQHRATTARQLLWHVCSVLILQSCRSPNVLILSGAVEVSCFKVSRNLLDIMLMLRSLRKSLHLQAS